MGIPESGSDRPHPRNGGGVGLALAAILLLLAGLFHGVLQPGHVVFANDGPLGVISANSSKLPEGFLGVWQDLNWLGAASPAAMPNVTQISGTLAGDPTLFARLYAPGSMMLLGLAAVFFCRRVGFAVPVACLVGIAAALNSNFFSYACWGLPGRALAAGCILAALALVYAPGGRPWLSSILAGFAVGLNVTEAADSGALLSLYFAAAVLWDAWIARREHPATGAVLAGSARLFIAVLAAAWIAYGSIDTLVNTSVKGVAATSENQSAKERWDFLTGWSFPKTDLLRIAIPGLLGYRLDSPDGGAYWGGVGPDGDPRNRFSGSGEYAGVLVLVVAAWAVARSLARGGTAMSEIERRRVHFWAVAAMLSLIFALGRHAPFYQLLLPLPLFNAMRIPMKFLHGFHLSVLVLFAHGLQAIARETLERKGSRAGGWSDTLKAWWSAAGTPRVERRFFGSLSAALAMAVVCGGIYLASRGAVVSHLETLVGKEQAGAVASHSFAEVGLFIGVLGIATLLLALVFAGAFTGSAAMRAWWMLGGLLALDLYRASTPWVIHYDYRRRYQRNAVIEFLTRDPAGSRIACRFMPTARQMLVAADDGIMPAVHNLWLEHHFQRYNVQTLDIIQAPRMPALDKAFLGNFEPSGQEMAEGNFRSVGRLWQLTATRYLLAARGYESQLNTAFAPKGVSFIPKLGFNLGMKADADPRALQADDFDAVPDPNGRYAIFEVAGALPRVRLFGRWEISTNDTATLARLRDPGFDPTTSVILANAPGVTPDAGAAEGEATILEYSPKRLVVKTRSPAARVLLDNARWHEDWKATIDGSPVPILRANHILRAVPVPPGEHTVEFRFLPDTRPLWVSVSAVMVGLGLTAFVTLARRRSQTTGPGSST